MMRPRRGLSLIEVMALISVTATLLVLLTVWLVTLLRGSDAGQKQLLWTVTQDRLIRQFRQDVHEAAAMSQSEPAMLLELQGADDRTVAYRLADERLVREEFAGEQRIRQELYRLSKGIELSVESEKKHDKPWLALVVSPREHRADEAPHAQIRIEAELGLLRRLADSLSQEDAP